MLAKSRIDRVRLYGGGENTVVLSGFKLCGDSCGLEGAQLVEALDDHGVGAEVDGTAAVPMVNVVRGCQLSRLLRFIRWSSKS
jgi:hypothetical protein